jgi:hypothetical protein
VMFKLKTANSLLTCSAMFLVIKEPCSGNLTSSFTRLGAEGKAMAEEDLGG